MLEIMGVSPALLSKQPHEVADESYPPVFRGDSEFRRVWSRLCWDAPETVPNVAWNFVIRQFLHWATVQNKNIWPDTLTRVDNNELSSFMLLRRRWITQHIDRLGILDGVKWLRSDTQIVEDKLGFTVNSQLYCRDLDFLGLRAIFREDNWRPDVRTHGHELGYRDWFRWLKTSERGVTKIGFSAPGRLRGYFWYSIVVPGHPFTPPNISTEDFVLTELWNPIVRTLRFKSLRRICHF
jgi:hypothetical protein